MSHDFYAEFWDERRHGANFGKVEGVDNIYQKIKLSSLHLSTEQNKRWARENKYSKWIKKEYINNVIKPQLELMEKLGIKEPNNLSSFVRDSILLKIAFTLKKPYISQDDEEFYIIDNPICKDKVFKVPLVRASSWKGALRWVSMKIRLIDSDSKSKEYYVQERIKLLRLFGNEKDSKFLDDLFRQKLGEEEGKEAIRQFEEKAKNYASKEGNRGGRLIFYPTFLDLIGLDIIAPHDRETRTVKVPIQFEVAPENAKGTFSLLYFPFDLISEEGERVKKEVKEDLEVLKEAIPTMLTKYGFGAKTTSGYGVVEIESGVLKTSFCWEKNFKDWNGFKQVINSIVEG